MPFRTICVLFHLIQEYGLDSPEGVSLLVSMAFIEHYNVSLGENRDMQAKSMTVHLDSHRRNTPTMLHIDDGQTHNDVNVGISRNTVSCCLQQGFSISKSRSLDFASAKNFRISWYEAELEFSRRLFNRFQNAG